MIPKRSSDRNIIKYWMPFGMMRRWLARRYGMVVRNGALVKATPTVKDTNGFYAKDLLPLWLAMRMSVVPSDCTEASKKTIDSLNHSLVKAREEAKKEKERLELECLTLKARHQALLDLLDVNKVAAPPRPEPAAAAPVKMIDAGAVYRRPLTKSWNAWRLMDDHPINVDMICSIGGDCIAAGQEKLRGLRRYSLPFDWCFCDGEPAIRNFAKQLVDDFKGFAKRENMEPIPGLKNAYKDRATGYNFMHHFEKPIDAPGEYERFSDVFQRRVKRLLAEFERSESVLFLLSKSWRIDIGCLNELRAAFQERWPGKRCYIIAATYNSVPSAVTSKGETYIVRIARDRNTYDMREKVFEWSFLDNVKLT